MGQFDLHDIFFIDHFSKEEDYFENEFRNYYEIIFIEEGWGKYYINEYVFPYHKGDIFLIAPGDKYLFRIAKKTQFCYFHFSELLFSGKMNLPDRSQWLSSIEHLINNPNLSSSDLSKEPYDKKLIWHIHNDILQEFKEQRQFYLDNISNMMSTILSVLARNVNYAVKDLKVETENLKAPITHILNFIRQHICDKKSTKIKAIAQKFNMTNNTLSAYFKKKTGQSLHRYILLYKIQLIKYRLDHTDFTVSEIAFQLGFTDESHLTRIFKKYVEMTPKKYRLKLQESKEKALSF